MQQPDSNQSQLNKLPVRQIHQEAQQYVNKEEFSSMQTQYATSRTEHVHIQSNQITTEQQTHLQHGGISQSSGPAIGLTEDFSPPIFEKIFRNARFAQGGNALFEGKLKGNPKPLVSWTRKGAPLLESTKFCMSYNEISGEVSLRINQIGPGDEGEYTCSARNQFGEAICSVHIQPEGNGMLVLDPTRKLEQLFDSRTYSQQEFHVDSFEYRLLRELSFRESITGKLESETYSSSADKFNKTIEQACAPQITQKPRNSKLVEGTDAMFSAKLVAHPQPRITWFFNGRKLTQSKKHKISFSDGLASLRVKSSNANDGGYYTLLAENSFGCVVSSALLAIEAISETPHIPHPDEISSHLEAGKALPPQFLKTYADRDVTEGGMVRFDCRIVGNPHPDVTWLINGQVVYDDVSHKILVNESGSHSLMITNVSLKDAGAVQCLARNKAGDVAVEAKLTVLEREQVVAPQFIQRFSTITVREGETFSLNANVVGSPPPCITWQKDGTQLTSDARRCISTDSGATCLKIVQTSVIDAGWYQCTAQNIAGSTVNRARVFVETPHDLLPQPKKRLNLPRPSKIILPEASTCPEIIYLRHIERGKQNLRTQEESVVYSAPCFIIPLKDLHQIEGSKVHFQARIEPLGDPSMIVEWLLNDRPIEASSRATSVFKFGFITLELIGISARDEGRYTCRAKNSAGIAESHALLSVMQRPLIESDSLNLNSLKYINSLEGRNDYHQGEATEEIVSQPPEFLRPLSDLGIFDEGKNAHFEAQVTPVDDSSMRVEWYKDGRPITASSRISAIFNFGYVSLNIMHLRPEDSGTYSVRVINRFGEVTSSSIIQVNPVSSVTSEVLHSEQQRYINEIEKLEIARQSQQNTFVEDKFEVLSPPKFVTELKNQLNILEGEHAHFEARVEPIGDATFLAEWFKDNKPLEASSRTTTFHNFGYVALTIKQLTKFDCGYYSCRISNAAGEAISSAQLSVISKIDKSYREEKEHTYKEFDYANKIEKGETVLHLPKFIGVLKGTNLILEGQRAHFEARIEPQSDLGLSIEWYHNGSAITAANRIQTYQDFGYIALDIHQVRPEDAGVYTVVARNTLGEAQLQATMTVESRSSIDTSCVHHGTFEKTQKIEKKWSTERNFEVEDISKSKPTFITALSKPQPVHEGKNIHLECRLEPIGDPTLRVEWFHNGKPVTVGSRFRTYNEFGFVVLDIVQTTVADSGEYTVRATNSLGHAHTSTTVCVIQRSNIVSDIQNENAYEEIQRFEDVSNYRNLVDEGITVVQPPQFTRPLHNIETLEGTNIHLECRLQPVGDPSMYVNWFVNGKPLKIGHRFRPAYEFDYVALDLLGCYASDSAVYSCQARNKLGEAITSCSVRIAAKNDVILDSQIETGVQKLTHLEERLCYKRKEFVDETVNIKPRFLSYPKNLTNMKEGDRAHFECKIEPVTDPNLKVEWFKNGQPIIIGHRFRPIHDFGYVALDIIDLIAEDSGIYTCRAENLNGFDETTTMLKCQSTEQIVTKTQNEIGLKQIHVLEDKSRFNKRESEYETSQQAPVFTTALQNLDIKESQRAHFECRLIPVSDPTLKIEWYHNGNPLQSGSRFTETNNFGFVALDILSCLPEDAGTYTCRAFNKLGEALTSAVAVIHTKKTVYSDTNHAKALLRLEQLENPAKRQRLKGPDDTVTQAPMFTLPLCDMRVAENQSVHFEARLIPVGDANLRVEWLRNGQPIEASNRITTMHDFGYVALNMKFVTSEDSGTYICRAVNEIGQAVTSALLFVQCKASIEMETQHESAMLKIFQLESNNKYQRSNDEEVTFAQAPWFVTKLTGPTQLLEGQSAHFECRIEPYQDPSLKVKWLHNGKALNTGHRFRTAFDFGFAALDVLTVYEEDSGEYSCHVSNNKGESFVSTILNVKSKASILRDTQHSGAMQKIQYLEDESRLKRRIEDDIVLTERPHFGRPLRNAVAKEGVPVHLEATLAPVNDPTMRVDWFCNGKPIQTGHRFKTTYDFGFVALDILYTYTEDTGTYMCKAKNLAGEAVTTCAVKVEATKTLDLDTLDSQRMEKIEQLERCVPLKEHVSEEKYTKPVFLTSLSNMDHLKEGDHAHFECRLEPINDANLRVEWFRNGKHIPFGHRFKITHDFGYVALDILSVYSEDTGIYMCKATNNLGEAVNTCSVKVQSRKSMILDTQHPDALQKIQRLESKNINVRPKAEATDFKAPHFKSELHGQPTLLEHQTAHFEAQVEPVHDPSLRIEFYHNDKPLASASRFHVTFDFGYISLDIGQVVAEDAGKYTVRAVSASGESCSSSFLQVIAQQSIISESQHPDGLKKIEELEKSAVFQRPEIETHATKQRPVFTSPLKNISHVNENQSALFECRLIPVGDPSLKVEWYRNEKLIEDSSRITKQHDFGLVSLNITNIRREDEGVYMCRAVNALGEAVTTASMRVVADAVIQNETQHPESILRINQLEQPSKAKVEEPEKVFAKPIFTQLLSGPLEVWEGEHARFEARVVPVGDPSLKIEWYNNGVLLKTASRLHTCHDFGFVTLDIESVVQTDAGVYTCRAVNSDGEAVSSAAIRVKLRSNIAGEPLIPESWEAIRLKEAEMKHSSKVFEDSVSETAPVFTTHLKDFNVLAEGQHVQLEGQVEPKTDPKMQVEWFKNGISLTNGSRIKTTFDFGLVTLSINCLRADDSGIYTCRAANRIGEAISTSSLKVEDKYWLQSKSLHPESLPRIQELEAPKLTQSTIDEPVFGIPAFISQLRDIKCKEGESVRFETRVEPSRDPTLKVEWFFNEQPLQAAAKAKPIYDFGYAALDLATVYPENNGVYSCKATNSKGYASTSAALTCSGGKSMYFETQHPQGTEGLRAIQKADDDLQNRYKRETILTTSSYSQPLWVKPLQKEIFLQEAQNLHLEGNVEPKEDPNLHIEWYFNGKLLQQGSRFKISHEFGFVTLDLSEIYERDQGIYVCKAFNESGESFTHSTVFCSAAENIIENTQHPKGTEGLEKIQNLEESLQKESASERTVEVGMAPQFTSVFNEIQNIDEGEIAHYEANLVPTGDQDMKIEWFFNGKSVEASHRIRTIYAFGMVALEVLGTKVEDSGVYTCRATNKFGSAEISSTLTCIEKTHGQKPVFTSTMKPLEGLKDGDSAHFECTLIPVNDPNLKLEWYHNGKLLRHSNRIKTESDFGFVVLDITYLQDHDSGEYVCRAFNKFGEDFSRTTLNCCGKGGVFYETLQPDSLLRIKDLESSSLVSQDSDVPIAGQPPKFVTQIKDVKSLLEGQSAHFEAHLTPTNDPELKVEWFFNGKRLPQGHRFRTFNDFGIVILDILYCYEENSGLYECKAINKYGEDSTQASLTCFSKDSLVLVSQLPRGMEGGLERISNLEYSSIQNKEQHEEEIRGSAPVFTMPLQNIEDVKEGENIHFEARLIPTDDPRLRIEWYWNGRPLKVGSRFRTFCDFGFVVLEISPVYPEDSGEYSCRAINEYGEAVTSACMNIHGKRNIILESQLPKGMEGTISRIAELEGFGASSDENLQEEDNGRPPEFLTTPFDLVINENSLAHFECRLSPVNDASMRVDWFHNGKSLCAGSRIKTINDFGFVILEISGCYQRDSGLYTCKATNKHGEASVACKLQVKGRQGIVIEPQLPSNFQTCTESLQKLEENMHKRQEIIIEEEIPNPPRFTEEIASNLDAIEGGALHFSCRVEPIGDPTMRIDWFYNGRPLPTGSRIHQLNDFGFIALDFDYIYARDSGEYVCRASNKWGVSTTSAKVICKGRKSIVYDSQLPDTMTAEKLKDLEKGPILRTPKEADEDFGPPRFTTEISSITVEEAESVRFECQVEPKNDPNLRIEWYRNGKPLPSGHRYRNIFDMGYVSLDILYVYEEDSGEYVCRAINNRGEAITTASISCKKLPSIILQSQVPRGMKSSEALTQMEATIKKYTSEIFLTENDLYDPDKRQPPRFVTQIKDQLNLVEMAVTKFECQLSPVGDPNMKVEWYFNGKPLLYKHRFQPIYDFGYVAMNFGWMYPEDSGEYVCRATNLYGSDETRASLKIVGKPGIVYDSQLPPHMDSIQRIREMEASWQLVPEKEDVDEKARVKPMFVSPLEAQTVEEGEPARFCVRVTGHPRPRVMWLINGHAIVHGSRYKLTNDGMYHLDIPKTRQYDTGKIEVVARNSVGEAIACTQLTIVPRSDDYRGVLKHSPRPWYDQELSSYQHERQENETAKLYVEHKQLLSENSAVKAGEHLQPKLQRSESPDWQKKVKSKQRDDYYSKLQDLETQQILKERNLRKDNHQVTLAGQNIVSAKADSKISKANKNDDVTRQEPSVPSIKSLSSTANMEPSESVVHGKEVYMNKKQQTQKEILGDIEITRKITETETTEMEHKGRIQERIVKGPVQPSKPPIFTKKIQPLRVFENEQAKFEVEFDGDPMPTVKWYRENYPIQSSPDLQIHTFSGKSILILRQVLIEDSAVFSCVAENIGGTAKCSANLVVERRRTGKGGLSPPSFISTINSCQVSTGQLARFDAKVSGSHPIDVYWLKNGSKINPGIKQKILEEDSTYTLLIIEPSLEDSGHYECVAVNAAGEARCDAECTVEPIVILEKTLTSQNERAPKLLENLKNQSVEEGSKVVFLCKLDGKPTPTARWMRGENIVKPSRYFQMTRQGELYQLTITEAFPEDEGTYKCIAENKLGSVQASAKLKVRPIENVDGPPTITALKDVSVTEGMPAQFKTTVTGKVKATNVQWFREGSLIPETPDFQMIFDGSSAVLLIATTYEEDTGVFTVRVTSSTGQVESSAKLIVKSKD